MRTSPGSTFPTAGSAAGAASNLRLFIFPGSKVLSAQPGLFSRLWARAGGAGACRGSPGSAEPRPPRALCGRAGVGEETRYAITVPGVFIALGPARWKMLPRPPSRAGCSLPPLGSSPFLFLLSPQNVGPLCTRRWGAGTPPTHTPPVDPAAPGGPAAPFCSGLGGCSFPPALSVPGGCSVLAQQPQPSLEALVLRRRVSAAVLRGGRHAKLAAVPALAGTECAGFGTALQGPGLAASRPGHPSSSQNKPHLPPSQLG